jgi:peptidoglycan pentaglycine glycine transferase (the first glycine)
MSLLVDHFSQRIDYHQCSEYGQVMRSIGWEVIQKDHSQVFIKKVGPVSFAKIQRPMAVDFTWLRQLRTRFHILQLFIDPGLPSHDAQPEMYKVHGYKRTLSHHAYTKTFLIDLSPPIPDVLKSFSQSARRHIRESEQSSIQVEAVPFSKVTLSLKREVVALHDEWSKEKKVLGYENSFLLSFIDAFKKKGTLITAREGSNLIGIVMHTEHDRVGMYFYAFSAVRGRQLSLPYRLAWESMKLAKSHGCDIYDFCSCYDERFPSQNPRWKGFSEFKLRFHPEPIYYPQSYQGNIFNI